MIVTFVSQCQKKALAKTRQILDSFANRIGDNTWQTVITQEGLDAVQRLLRQNASKNTAVSCHRNRGYGGTELVWIVGNHRQFNHLGHVPVHRTQQVITVKEDDWIYLPLIRVLVALAALIHDWGKAMQRFQKKLDPKHSQKKALGDPLRHEWISCLLLQAFVSLTGNSDSDEAWLKQLQDASWSEETLIKKVQDAQTPLKDLPCAASMIAWLVLTHHRLPQAPESQIHTLAEDQTNALADVLRLITADFGYENLYADKNYAQQRQECFVFPNGVLRQSEPWLKQLRRWAKKCLDQLPLLQQAMDTGAWRAVLYQARLALMWGDHYYSSQEKDAHWPDRIALFANTELIEKAGEIKRDYKQRLDEHLVHVSKEALNMTRLLRLCQQLSQEQVAVAQVQALKKRSTLNKFAWQDKAVQSIKSWRTHLKPGASVAEQGMFVVNMASTGSGKTFANAKIMRALSFNGDSLRYVLALGLRTLTLQTGDEYRERVGLSKSELAVQIGSQAVLDLHQVSRRATEIEDHDELGGSESQESLFDGTLDYKGLLPEGPLATVLKTPKHQQLLYAPVLVCTIDHLMAATETRRGGRYILPSLRLMSSDLVIDEIDDFSGSDLIAIGRLIHLAGMLGRKIMISSATIPPDLAEGYFHAYREGWRIHQAFHGRHAEDLYAAWVDEFGTEIQAFLPTQTLSAPQQYAKAHHRFVTKRVKKLAKMPVRRRACIVPCDAQHLAQAYPDCENLQERYFACLQETIIEAHCQHHSLDERTQKRVSFGVVRMANVEPCIDFTRFLLQAPWMGSVAPRVMAYHARQVLLLRSEQEQHLDQVLKRKEKAGETPLVLLNPVVREHLDCTEAEDVIFILVTTPVEETGRDHDFDWAIIEPSSYRSIVQLAGRVLRHRELAITEPNIYLMQYNLRALRGNSPAYYHPGYESKANGLDTYDLQTLLQDVDIAQSIDAIPRIQKPEPLQPRQRLVDLEHFVMAQWLTQYTRTGPSCLQGWLNESWWLTAIPQKLQPFRQGEPQHFYRYVWEAEELVFKEQVTRQQWEPCASATLRQSEPLCAQERQRLWLVRDYEQALHRISEAKAISMREASMRYGEISLRKSLTQQQLSYSDQWGISTGR